MEKLFYLFINIFWLFDVFNLPFMEVYDTVYPINGFEWALIFVALFVVDVIWDG